MIKIERTDVSGWEAAIRGMRNPMNSWDKSDSSFQHDPTCGSNVNCNQCEDAHRYLCDSWHIGENDLDLMKRLSAAGSDHGKFLRMINVSADITAPLYWWKEYDTYKVGTVENSTSTMHKIPAKEFAMDDFSCEHLDKEGKKLLHQKISYLNRNREKYNETKDKKHWWNMIQSLESSFNQMRTVQLNYEVLKRIYFARRSHKLDEWHTLCDWIKSLPYFSEIVLGGGSGD